MSHYLQVFSIDRITGQKRTAKIFAVDGAKQTESSTDSSGLGKVRLFDNTKGIIVAQAGESWTMSTTGWSRDQYYADLNRATGYTERPVYKPGDTVHFRGSLRDRETLKPLKGSIFIAVCSTNEQIWNGQLPLSDMGSYAGQFELSPYARVSQDYAGYVIRYNRNRALSCDDWRDDDRYLLSFAVADYVKPEYSVELELPERVLQGESLRVQAKAQYLFGGALSNARAKFSVSSSRRIVGDDPFPDDFGFEYSQSDTRDLKEAEAQDVEAVTAFDAAGQAFLTMGIERDEFASPRRYDATVEVEDESRNVQTRQASVVAFPSSIRVALRGTKEIVRAGEPLIVDVRTRDLRGAKANATVELQLVRQEYIRVRTGGQPEFDYVLKETPTDKATIQTRDGAAKFVFTPTVGGGYVVRARARDAQNRLSKGEDFTWVTAANDNWVWNAERVDAQLDKRECRVGDTATALFMNITPGADVWMTLEGNGILESRIVRSTARTLAWTFKITSQMQPNVHVKIAYILNARASGSDWFANHYFGNAGTIITVPSVQQKLEIQVKPSQEKSAPGSKAALEFRVKDTLGKPVSAELSVGVVDEGVYLVRSDEALNPFDVIHGWQPNLVTTASSDDHPFEGGGGGGGDGENGGTTPPTNVDADAGRVRRNFRDTAVWSPMLRTDANGYAKLEFTYPDNLTTWRITARGETLDAKAGEARAQTLVTKDVLARLIMPAQVVRGDTLQLRGIVNNNTTQAATGAFKFALQGLNGGYVERARQCQKYS